MQRRRPFSRHDGFFASLQRVEDRLASEQHQDPPPRPTATAQQPEPSPLSDTMTTGSPLILFDPALPSAAGSRGSSGPALDFLTDHTEQDQQRVHQDGDDDDGGGVEEDIARLMALLGLSPPTDGDGSHDDAEEDEAGGCDCSGADGFMAKVVGVAGPKCDAEKRRLDAWIRHYHRGEGVGGCREPARLAHLLLARASSDTAAVEFPVTVKSFLERDAPRESNE
nr:unnamed protein product [Digitaria exilis]